MLNTALLPLSGRETARRLRTLVADLTQLGTRRVLLLHVASGARTAPGRRRRLEEAQELFTDAGIAATTELRSGSPPFQIATAARESADYVAFCWRRKSWLQRTVVGSTAGDTIRLSDTPVYVHKAALTRSRWLPFPAAEAAHLHQSSEDGSDPYVVVYATDFGPADADIMPYLRRLSRPHTQLVLLHVARRAPDPAAEQRREAYAEHNLKRLAGECGASEVTYRAVTGSPKRHLAHEASRLGAHLLVLGKRDKQSALETILGSTAETLVHQTRASLFIVPPSRLVVSTPADQTEAGSR